MEERKEFVTAGRLALAFGVHDTTIRNYVKAGIIAPDIVLPTGGKRYALDRCLKALREHFAAKEVE